MNLIDPTVARVVPNAPVSPDAPPRDKRADGPAKPGSRLWLWFVAAFVVQGLVWTTLFVIAHQNPVAEVPLAGATGHKAQPTGQRTDLSQPTKPGP
jgi:hypothetical protein